MRRMLMLNFVTFITLAFICFPASARVMEVSDAAIARQATPAVVNIAEWKVRPATKPGRPPGLIKVYASGFIIDPSGLIVTNKHVVDGALVIHVIFSNGDLVPAHLIVAAAMLDLAIIKVDVDHPLPALKWGNSGHLQVGDPVLTMGNPLGLGMSVSAGIVSALNRNLHDSPFDSYIQTDADINYGNSGGPLLNGDGDVVGIDTALYNPVAQGGFIGIGFAIPSNLASFTVEFLLNPNHPKPGWIGVNLQDLNDRLADAMGLQKVAGAIISVVDPSGPAHQAGLQPADVLETIDGVQQSDSRDFMRTIVKLPVGTTVHLAGWRNGKPFNTTVNVAAWPNYMPSHGITQAQAAKMMAEKAPDPGIRLASLTEYTRKQYGLNPKLSGALVSSVEPDSEAGELGIVPGDVIINVQGQPVATPDEVRHAIEAAHDERRHYLALLVQGKSALRWVSLSITSAGS